MTYQEKKPQLYRKVNTRARMVYHNIGSDFCHERNTKKQKEFEEFGVKIQAMKGNAERGLDYTPLFKFLLSKVGKVWEDVYREAISRLDKEEKIFWIVAKNEYDKQDVVSVTGNTYYSGLYIDEKGFLQKVNPNFNDIKSLVSCTCCTFSFNGVPIKI